MESVEFMTPKIHISVSTPLLHTIRCTAEAIRPVTNLYPSAYNDWVIAIRKAEVYARWLDSL